jgi:hypothetical protein
MDVAVPYINSCIGLDLQADKVGTAQAGRPLQHYMKRVNGSTDVILE